MALCASRAATLLRVRCQAAPLLRGADLRVYSTATSRSDLLKSIKTHCTNWIEQKRPVAMERFNDLSKRWNVMSGYENILHHKEQVELESARLKELQEQKNEAKSAYVNAVAERSAAQRKISDLLTRKASWNDSDLIEYTKLLHSEHSFAKAEERSEQEYEQAEDRMERGFDDLMRSVMRRYHEEHLWSDRVRSVSSYVSLGMGALNVLIFMLALLLVEPFKRRKLARTLEERIKASEKEAYERMQATVTSVDEHLARLEGRLTGTSTGTSVASAASAKRGEGGASAPASAPAEPVSPPAAPPRRLFPPLPKFAWMDRLVHWLQVLRYETVHLVRTYLPFTQSEQVSLAAGTTGALVAGVLSYWASVLFL
ncbi:sensitivity to high expression protein she9 [Malassezia furfur]|uniref:Sensitive to high expression protein 9, mitochondrial n=1 Tax=Malassezia furfur TaxID=55194 RepID=A0ABY8EQW5_MALFU|nr:sensitivity to high expression protein she9 [Malassezia furfur]